jgi:hypothetical protein
MPNARWIVNPGIFIDMNVEKTHFEIYTQKGFELLGLKNKVLVFDKRTENKQTFDDVVSVFEPSPEGNFLVAKLFNIKMFDQGEDKTNNFFKKFFILLDDQYETKCYQVDEFQKNLGFFKLKEVTLKGS